MSHGLEEAERLVLQGLKVAGLGAKDLEELPGGDPRKVALGKLVRERTVTSWVAGGEAENAEHREPQSDVEKNGMEEPLQRGCPERLPNISVRKETE